MAAIMPSQPAPAVPPARSTAATFERRLDVVVTSLSSDAHTWNLVYLELLLEELHCRVTNLGACTPDQVILDACAGNQPDLLVISSVNGHGVHDGLRLITELRAHPPLRALPVVIGGRLDATGGADRTTTTRLLEAGFDAVFDDASGIALFRSMVHRIASVPAAPATVTGPIAPIGAR